MPACIRELDFDCQAIRTNAIPMLQSVKNSVWTLLFASLACSSPCSASPFARIRDIDVVAFNAAATPTLIGSRIDRLAAFRCEGSPSTCQRVALQVDERDAHFRWALDAGARPVRDDSPGILDDNDVLFFRARDAGSSPPVAGEMPGVRRAVLDIHDPLDGRNARLLLAESAMPLPALRAGVRYDADDDTFRGRRVTLGFVAGIPQALFLDEGGPDLLDRIKVRASASLLWGLLRFARDESDLTTSVTGWRNGPLRATRHQEQRVRLGWGIRSPRFSTYTFFYPDFAELPVSLRLAHAPAVLFGDIRVEVILDFTDLTGWTLELPGRPSLPVGSVRAEEVAGTETEWFALRSASGTLLQVIDVSGSLASTRRRLIYRDDDSPEPPEEIPGAHPAIGYRIDRWDEVEAGGHHLRARCFALPPDADAGSFVAGLRNPLVVQVLPDAGDVSVGDGSGSR